ncbi:hypothetical protein J6TS1_42110 [Siminovitchia terrae]|uniref:Uncharacterized protein n=1 Tax=Siminovitchia terrae TaxID=1914933 RepID=A0ABQ4L227_SIMTE|nr:hypothetical protein J6TS1_42110 [Siminovitchia terrae]
MFSEGAVSLRRHCSHVYDLTYAGMLAIYLKVTQFMGLLMRTLPWIIKKSSWEAEN